MSDSFLTSESTNPTPREAAPGVSSAEAVDRGSSANATNSETDAEIVDGPPGAPDITVAAESEDASYFGLRRGDQLFAGVLAVVGLILMGLHWVQLTEWGRLPIEIERLPAREFVYRIDINQATWVEWAQLSGIGDTLARRIVEDRDENGPFPSIDDLQRVKGIGPKTVERLRPQLTVDAD